LPEETTSFSNKKVKLIKLKEDYIIEILITEKSILISPKNLLPRELLKHPCVLAINTHKVNVDVA